MTRATKRMLACYPVVFAGIIAVKLWGQPDTDVSMFIGACTLGACVIVGMVVGRR